MLLDNLLFRKESGEKIDQVIEYVKEQIDSNKSLSIVVGCDSQNKRYSTTYVTVITFVFSGHKGAHCIYWRNNVSKIKDRRIRLMGEVQRSVEIALFLRDGGVKVNCVDLDFNEKEIARSSELVAEARGWVLGLDFNCTVKPQEQCASRYADHLVRN